MYPKSVSTDKKLYIHTTKTIEQISNSVSTVFTYQEEPLCFQTQEAESNRLSISLSVLFSEPQIQRQLKPSQFLSPQSRVPFSLSNSVTG